MAKNLRRPNYFFNTNPNLREQGNRSVHLAESGNAIERVFLIRRAEALGGEPISNSGGLHTVHIGLSTLHKAQSTNPDSIEDTHLVSASLRAGVLVTPARFLVPWAERWHSYHIISYHIISYHIISYYIISILISYHIISYQYWYHIISYHINIRSYQYHIISISYHIKIDTFGRAVRLLVALTRIWHHYVWDLGETCGWFGVVYAYMGLSSQRLDAV